MKDICLRTRQIALYFIDNKSTVRATAQHFGMAKSTVHYDLSVRLPSVDYFLYRKVKKLLEKNFEEKSIRGGLATQKKYKKS